MTCACSRGSAGPFPPEGGASRRFVQFRAHLVAPEWAESGRPPARGHPSSQRSRTRMESLIDGINGIIWSKALIVACLGAGLY
ncbi:hypothetical protein SB773_33640, partial [Bacillus sp. SIMBA_074]